MLFRVGLENCPINRVQWAMLAGGLLPAAGLVLLDRDLQIKAEGIGKWRCQVTVGQGEPGFSQPLWTGIPSSLLKMPPAMHSPTDM